MLFLVVLQLAKIRLKDNIIKDIDDVLREGTVGIVSRVMMLSFVTLVTPIIIRAIVQMTRLGIALTLTIM